MAITDVRLPGGPGRGESPAETGDLCALGLNELAGDPEASQIVARLTRTDVQHGPAPVWTAAFNSFI